MVNEVSKEPKSSKYLNTEVHSNSGRDLYSLRELDIKKECLIKIVLPLAQRVMDEKTDISNGLKDDKPDYIEVRDRTGWGYFRKVQTEILPSGKIQLYDIGPSGHSKMLASEYNLNFDQDGKITEATEDKDYGSKHVSVVYSISSFDKGGTTGYDAKPKSVVLTTKEGNKEHVKLFIGTDLDGDDLLEEIPFPNNFAQVLTYKLRE
ncbi:MAG: hypothetical protein M1465_03225 [Candidatus Marsarchaeota archaeon]|jgi:hypothetical protein|nr:hypothetical protein [Candidatus Marsarchaeota archaeon]